MEIRHKSEGNRIIFSARTGEDLIKWDKSPRRRVHRNTSSPRGCFCEDKSSYGRFPHKFRVGRFRRNFIRYSQGENSSG